MTGGASGSGRALARRFASEGARHVVVVDIDGDGARDVAAEVGGTAITADVGHGPDMSRGVHQTEDEVGSIDLFCSNAGLFVPGDAEVSDELWEASWRVNVLAHVHMARTLVPRMLERGRGYLLQTASAAGWLSQIGSAPYSTTKHAAVGFADLSAAQPVRSLRRLPLDELWRTFGGLPEAPHRLGRGF